MLNDFKKKGGGGGGKKNMKKCYKSAVKCQGCCYSKKSTDRGQTRKFKGKVLPRKNIKTSRKEITKKNIQFLEGLGLKVKQKEQ